MNKGAVSVIEQYCTWTVR